jgi:hypothetical protein
MKIELNCESHQKETHTGWKTFCTVLPNLKVEGVLWIWIIRLVSQKKSH